MASRGRTFTTSELSLSSSNDIISIIFIQSCIHRTWGNIECKIMEGFEMSNKDWRFCNKGTDVSWCPVTLHMLNNIKITKECNYVIHNQTRHWTCLFTLFFFCSLPSFIFLKNEQGAKVYTIWPCKNQIDVLCFLVQAWGHQYANILLTAYQTNLE